MTTELIPPVPEQNDMKAILDNKMRRWREANDALLAAAKKLTRLHAAYNGPEMDDLRYAIARMEAVN